MNLQNKKILLIIHAGALGGAERQALGLAKYLIKDYNCKVDLLLTFSDETTKEFDDFAKECFIEKILFFGTPYVYLPKEISIKNLKRLKWSIQSLMRLRKGLKEYKHEIVIPFLNFPSKIAFYIYKMIPSVKFTFWHQLGLDNIKLDYFESIAVNNVPCVIGNAPNCLDMFEDPYHINKKKLNVLPQYVTLEKIKVDKVLLKRNYNIPENSIVIGMVAHFRSDKYHDLLLDAFIKLNKKCNNVHLLFLGNKDNNIPSHDKYLNLKEKIEINKLENKVTILSNENVNEVLNIIDIGVLVSLIEGTPNAVMEYMLYGIPVIASNHPGCKGLLEDSEFLIENDEAVLIEKLIQLVGNEELRVQEGNRNSELIKKYDIETYIKKLEAIITKYI